MAAIRETLILEDKFSGPLNRYINKQQEAATKTASTTSASSKMANAAARLGAFFKSAASGAQGLTRSQAQMSSATSQLVDQLSGLEAGIHGAFTDAEADAALKNLQQQMQKVGLVWTNSADQMEAADMLVRVGLQQLAAEGKLAASAMVENADAAERAAAAQQKHESRLSSVKGALKSFISMLSGANRAEKAYDGINKQLTRFALSIFSVSKIMQFFESSIARAPQSIQDSWNNLGSTLKDTFAGVVVSALQGLQPHLDRLNAALNSPAGQKMARGLEALANVGGRAIGFLLDIVSQLVEFLGNNFQTVMTIAAVAASIFAAQMFLSAAATLATAWPILLIVGLIAAFVIGLQAAGVTSEQIFSTIGAGAGWLYALVYNIIADVWNVIAVFAEFFANVFDNPVAAVANLFFGVFDAILGVVETVAGAIDALLGTDMAGAVSGFREKINGWVSDTFGENKIKIDRMDKISYTDTMSNFASKGSALSNALSDFSLSNMSGIDLLDDISGSSASTAGSAGNIEKSIDATQEDIKSLVDVAERRYVNNINLTAQTPVINVNGQNTGRTAADRQNLANAIRDVLLEQMSSGSSRSTAIAHR